MKKCNAVEILNESFPSKRGIRKQAIDSIVKVINKECKESSLNYHELYLIADEAVTNAMEHGNKWDPEKYINVIIRKYEDSIKLTIKDEGKGFITGNIKQNDEDVKNLKPRGRGIYIIKQFCELKWNKIGNQIEIQINYEK